MFSSLYNYEAHFPPAGLAVRLNCWVKADNELLKNSTLKKIAVSGKYI